jgi:predicted nucleic acid-binding protein
VIAFLDTSVLVTKYVREAGSARFARLWETDVKMAVSAVAYAEAAAVIHRKHREGSISIEQSASMGESLKGDGATFIVTDVTELLHPYLDHLLANHPLRGFDAIHLASAMLLSRQCEEEVVFLSADRRLGEAAESEGFRTTF